MTLTEEVTLFCVVFTTLFLFIFPPLSIPFIILIVMFVWGGIRDVPANPPTVALTTVWGKRRPNVIHERIVLVSPFFPLVENLIFVGKARQSRVIDLKNIRCKAVLATSGKKKNKLIGGTVGVRVGIVIQVDDNNPQNLIDYLNAGGKGWPPLHHKNGVVSVDKEAEQRDERDAVWKQLEMTVVGALRNEGGNRTWKEMSNSKAELSALLISRMTGQRPTLRVVRNEHEIPVPDLNPHSPYEYQTEPIPEGYTFQEEDYLAFLHQINLTGAQDVKALGVILRSITVEEVIPEGELKKDAEQSDREAAQRDAEIIDFDTERMLAKQYIAAATKEKETLSMRDALMMVRINRKRADEVVITNTTGDPMLGAAGLFNRGGGGGRGVKDPSQNANDKGPDSQA